MGTDSAHPVPALKGNTVENLNWQKSTFSQDSSNCVEIARTSDGRIFLRESEDPSGSIVQTDRAKLAAFIKGVKAGEFDHYTA